MKHMALVRQLAEAMIAQPCGVPDPHVHARDVQLAQDLLDVLDSLDESTETASHGSLYVVQDTFGSTCSNGPHDTVRSESEQSESD